MLEWFLETTIVTAVLAVVATLACRLRPSTPSIRHVLWLVVLIKLITPPLVAWPWARHFEDLAQPSASVPVISAAGELDREQLDPLEISEPPPPESELAAADAQIEVSNSPSLPTLATTPITVPELEITEKSTPHSAWAFWPSLPALAVLVRWITLIWLAASVVLGAGQLIRITRFRNRLRLATPAPDDLVNQAKQIGQYLGVSVPSIRVMPDLGTPVLWCLGRPLLLLPESLVKTLPIDRWRGILTHELAHLRRGDHWVSRLELAAGFIWWWNPIYWLTRARLDAEAELACDAWVVSTLPDDRLVYAEVLFDICATLSLAKPVAPTLGITGSGRFFEQRMTMILHDRIRCRVSPLALLGAALLTLLALPSWLLAKTPALATTDRQAPVSIGQGSDRGLATSVFDDDDDDKQSAKRDKSDDDDDEDEDEDADDDDDEAKQRASAEAQVEAAKAALEEAKANLEVAKARAQAAKTQAEAAANKVQKAKAKVKKSGDDVEVDLSRIEKEIESKFGPEFEKKMEALGKEIESKFGPEFEKKMEALGKEIESKFGPEFEKKMEALGKELETRLGPGSEFAKRMEALGKELEAKFGPDSEFAKKLKEKAAASRSGSTRDQKESSSSRNLVKPQPKITVKPGSRRERRIKELEAQIKKLMDEVKSLEESDDDNEE
jgi:beta-lactamase regulating signal transducer with metallopeptidase domain